MATLGKEKMFLTIKALERANAFAPSSDYSATIVSSSFF